MAKRGADNQLTKDDRSDGENEDEAGLRDTPLAPKEGRQIRGLPKRRAQAAETLSVESQAPSASGPATPSNPFASGGFSFGANTTKPTSFGTSSSSDLPAKPAAQTPSFSFGSAASAAPASSSPAPAKSPFAGFSFAAPVPSSSDAAKPTPSFGFGTTAAASSLANPSSSESQSVIPNADKAGFSSASGSTPLFGSQPGASTGFSFGGSATGLSSSSPFSFGAKPVSSEPSSSATVNKSSAPASPPDLGSQAAAPIPPSTGVAPTPSEGSSRTNGASVNGLSPSQSSLPAEGEVTYYTSIRGLNTSILSFLTSKVENDPFIDLSSALGSLQKQYQKYLAEVEDKAEWRPAGSKSAANGTVNGSAESSSAPKPPSLPSVPTNIFTPGLSSSTPAKSATPPPAGTGFVPKTSTASSSSSSPFQFGGAPKSTTTPKPSAEVTKLVEDAIADKPEEESAESLPPTTEPPKFQFGASSAAPASTPSKTGSLFSFAPSAPLHPATPESKTFAPSSNVEAAGSTPPPAKLGKFGPGGSQPQLAFGGAKTSPVASTSPSSQKATGFGFGASASSSSSSAPSFGFGSNGSAGFSFGAKPASEAAPSVTPSFSFGGKPSSDTAASSTPSFSFGSKPSSAAAPTFSFGLTSSTSKPIFSLGSDPDKPPPTTASASTLTSSTPAFSFGASTSTAPSTALPSAEGSAEATPEPSSPSKNFAEIGGAGEENEETVMEMRGKLYHFEEGANKLDGLGVLKVKRTKSDEGDSDSRKRRLLMRADGNGNIVLNMAITKQFEPTTDNAWVKFLGFDAKGTGRPYSLRVKTAQAATELVEALKKEVADIKE
ncbi:hypothetical protein BCR39DRAFT_518540 [Naematelia encephala]|uniref:RanBD1 domain-containing protein n=1 Tax=Naematelia encephala TaxID=71784 RepID=A0A1Y2BJ34_9TREE|nr:hypothetical protein BCR39DRAFT_518540 [Naematelia encephala]